MQTLSSAVVVIAAVHGKPADIARWAIPFV